MDENALIFRQVRSDIEALNLSQAEELLDGVEDHCAEWHFLKGAVYYRKGWMDEAQTHYETAARMEPENQEYSQAVERMRTQMQAHYSPNDHPFGTMCEDVLPAFGCGICTCVKCIQIVSASSTCCGFCACLYCCHEMEGFY